MATSKKKDEEYWMEQRRLVAEDGGHMGWTHDHFPGCNDKVVSVSDPDTGEKKEMVQGDLFSP